MASLNSRLLNSSGNDLEIVSDAENAIASDGYLNYSSFSYCYEKDDRSSSIFPIAKFVAHRCKSSKEVLAKLTSLRIWQSGHDPAMISSLFLKLTGDEATPVDGSIILFYDNFEENLAYLVHSAMIFGWDLTVLCVEQSTWFDISHDGHFIANFNADKEQVMNEFRSYTSRIASL